MVKKVINYVSSFDMDPSTFPISPSPTPKMPFDITKAGLLTRDESFSSGSDSEGKDEEGVRGRPSWIGRLIDWVLKTVGLYEFFRARGSAKVSPGLVETEDNLVVKGAIREETSRIFTHALSVRKSPFDRNKYRPLVLGNGLKVMLVSDSEADRCACALSLAVGSMSDPAGLPGLAHFCEHMLFLGSKKYPEPEGFGFDDFVGAHGGVAHGFTARDSTTFSFDILPQHFEVVLDHFAQFFICPLYETEAAEREVNILDSENREHIPDDLLRVLRVDSFTSDHNHPYSKFTTGNKEILWYKPIKNFINVSELLQTYHDNNYSANLMTLAVIGAQGLDELQAIIEPMFAVIKNQNIKMPAWYRSPYKEKEYLTQIDIVPLQNIRQLFVKFYVPDPTPFFKTGSMKYISYVLEHGGAGGLISFLRGKSLANKMEAKVTIPGRGFGFFTIKIELTLEGFEKVDTVLMHIFQYLALMRQKGPQKWLWKEMAEVDGIKFRYHEKPDSELYVNKLVKRMHVYPMKHILRADHLSTTFDLKHIKELMEYLVVEKCRIITVSEGNRPNAKLFEQWYGVQFNINKISKFRVKAWKECGLHPQLKFPARNYFIPSDFSLKAGNNPFYPETTPAPPRRIVNTPLHEIWFLEDSVFLIPKTVIITELYSLLPPMSSHNSAMNYILADAIQDECSESIYFAKQAGISVTVLGTVNGIEITLDGYSDKIEPLWTHVFRSLLDFKLNEERFEILTLTLRASLNKWKNMAPYELAELCTTLLLTEQRWAHDEIIEGLAEVTLERLRKYSRDFMKKLKLHWIVFGNATETEVRKLAMRADAALSGKKTEPIPALEVTRVREVQLEAGFDQTYRQKNLDNVSSCVSVYFQVGPHAVPESMKLEVLNQIAAEPCNVHLNVKHHLGYHVVTFVRRVNGNIGWQVVAQSLRDSIFVEAAIDEFLLMLKDVIESIEEDKFVLSKNVVLTKPRTCMERATQIWSEVYSQQYDFNRRGAELAELAKLTRKDLLDFYCNLVGPSVSSVEVGKRLGVHIMGSEECKLLRDLPKLAQRQAKLIESIPEWKKSRMGSIKS